MGFKLKSGNKPSFKNMGSSLNKMSAFKATADEMREAGVSLDTIKKSHGTRGYDEAYEKRDKNIYGDLSKDEYTTESKRQMDNYKKTGKWDAPKEAMRSKAADTSKKNPVTGRTKTTTGDKDPNTGADRVTTTTTRKDGTTAKVKSETDDKKTVSKTSRDGSKQKNVVKTGLSTDTKADDVKTKTKIKGGDKPTQKTKTKTADTVTKTETDLNTGEETKSTTRKRLGKGLIKDVVAKAKNKRKSKKVALPGENPGDLSEAQVRGRTAEEKYAKEQKKK